MAKIQRNPISDPQTIEALESIRQKNDGVLSPEAVVREAKRKTSPLHRYFTWEDDQAAEAWRLHQARNLIRVVVMVDDQGDREPFRTYVSLSNDRGADGGYRHVVDVMKDDDMRGQLLDEALEAIAVLERKYAHLKELAGVFAEARKVRRVRPAAQLAASA